ncbi:DNA replication complex subunit Gins51 [Halorubrum pallidum]
MNLDELRSAQAKERRKDSLQHLRDSFYDDVAAYVADLRAARDRRAEQVDKPFSDDDVRRMSDEVETAEEVAEALYERRVGKVVKIASFAAADMPVEDEGMTTEERELFDDLVDRIGENKSRVLDVLSGDAPPSSDPDATAQSADSDRSTSDVSEATPDSVEATSDSGSPSADADHSALAGAMGGSEPDEAGGSPLDDGDAVDLDEPGDALPEDTVDALADSAPEATTADEGDGAPAGATGDTAESGAARDDARREATTDGSGDPTASAGATEVPPEPAPPGAPGVKESGVAGQSGSDGDAESDTSPTGEGDPDGAAASGPAARDDRTTVKITRDVGAILGVDDREYELASEDVVTLPAENADPLVRRDAAERLE